MGLVDDQDLPFDRGERRAVDVHQFVARKQHVELDGRVPFHLVQLRAARAYGALGERELVLTGYTTAFRASIKRE